MVTEIKSYIKEWENRCYSNGLPDIAPLQLESKNLVPSYHRIALCILKNDVTLKSLGFAPNKSKYYSMLKKIEINKREGAIIQLTLF